MSTARSLKSIFAMIVAVSLTTAWAESSAYATSSAKDTKSTTKRTKSAKSTRNTKRAESTESAESAARKPLILDSQNGISDGQSGTVLQTAPFSHQPIVGAQSIAAPAELAPNSSTPYIVAPYIELPTGGGTSQPPRPQPRPVQRSQ
nr:hypothetical protein HUO10_003539 [Paraburkholderia busanensis]